MHGSQLYLCHKEPARSKQSTPPMGLVLYGIKLLAKQILGSILDIEVDQSPPGLASCSWSGPTISVRTGWPSYGISVILWRRPEDLNSPWTGWISPPCSSLSSPPSSNTESGWTPTFPQSSSPSLSWRASAEPWIPIWTWFPGRCLTFLHREVSQEINSA